MADAATPADWLAPQWPAPPGVHALCTTRAGGVSQPPYDSLNLGAHVGDDLQAVQANRRALQAAIEARTPGARAVFLTQVHGNGVVVLDAATPDGTEADACVAASGGAACTIMVADCLPVLLTNRSGTVVAAAHAGWRGLAGAGMAGGGILETVFERFCALALDGRAQAAINSGASGLAGDTAAPLGGHASEAAGDLLAWLGPCIGPDAFEVGGEVRAAFCSADPASEVCFVPQPGAGGKYLCDLAALARLRLQALGISAVYGNDSTRTWCTVSNPSRFFSHRRGSAASGGSGRFAACIWLG